MKFMVSSSTFLDDPSPPHSYVETLILQGCRKSDDGVHQEGHVLETPGDILIRGLW